MSARTDVHANGVAALWWTPDHRAEEVFRWQKDSTPYAPEHQWT